VQIEILSDSILNDIFKKILYPESQIRILYLVNELIQYFFSNLKFIMIAQRIIIIIRNYIFFHIIQLFK